MSTPRFDRQLKRGRGHPSGWSDFCLTKGNAIAATVVPLILVGLLLVTVACQGGPLEPTPTAVPLAETATLQPRPTRAASVTSDSRVESSPVVNRPSPATDTPEPMPTLSGLIADVGARLARRTVMSFLDRLVSGNVDGAPALFLTDSAQGGPAGEWLSQLSDSEARLRKASLLEFTTTNDKTYEARGELDWIQDAEGRAAIQGIELLLVYQRGLWLIDDIRLEPIGTGTPTPTPKLASITLQKEY